MIKYLKNLIKGRKQQCTIPNVVASYSIEQNLEIFDLANITIKQHKDGFSIWMLEKCEDGELRKRWIVDASHVLKDARIELSNNDGRDFRSVYVADENCIEIQRR